MCCSYSLHSAVQIVDFNSIKIINFFHIVCFWCTRNSKMLFGLLASSHPPSLSLSPIHSLLQMTFLLRMLLSFKFKQEKFFWPFYFSFNFQMNRICCSHLSRIPFETIDLKENRLHRRIPILFNRRRNHWVFLFACSYDDSFGYEC